MRVPTPLPEATQGIRPNLRHDIPAGVVVFLVALPLCIGVAFASGAPPIAGLTTGVIAGVVIAWASGSQLSVSGPAAGLAVIVLDAITGLGSYEAFLTAVCLAGVFQVILGFLRAGIIAYYFPTSVIKGMLAGIGGVLVLKQLPHLVGFDVEVFLSPSDGAWLVPMSRLLASVHPGALVVAVASGATLVAWGRVAALRRLKYIPAPLAAVVVGIVLNVVFAEVLPALHLDRDHMVEIPVIETFGQLRGQLAFPDFGAIWRADVLKVAGVLAVVASVETLLCIEAVDRLDPYNRTSPTSRELKAQGLGNVLAGLAGGIPMTSVIVRSSANVQAGGRTRTAAFIHGVLLLATVLLIPRVLNMIPVAALAVILLQIGFKLMAPSLFRQVYVRGRTQWLPFAITFAGIVFLDLLTGLIAGLVVAVYFVLRVNAAAPFYLHRLKTVEDHGREHSRIELGEHVSFLNKASLNALLHQFHDGAVVEIDASRCRHIDHDAREIIDDFARAAPLRKIRVTIEGLDPRTV